jgi:hypothetical protein
MHILIYLVFILLIIVAVIYGIYRIVHELDRNRSMKQLGELKECPFSYRPYMDDGSWYVVFDLGDDLRLLCDYNLGIRADGYYGISQITIEGINTRHNNKIQLKIGQSIFPIIQKVEEVVEWLEKQPFDCTWDEEFKCAWENMKKKLNGLRLLEAKSKEKDKN